MASVSISGMLDKIGSSDPDLRYMAVSDLFNELQKASFACNSTVENKICEEILNKTVDASSDVCSLAIKCLAPLLAKCSGENGRKLVKQLCDNQDPNHQGSKGKDKNNKKKQAAASNANVSMDAKFRSIALKTLISDTKPGESGSSKVLVEETVPRMLAIVKSAQGQQKGEEDALGESLDILHELLKKFSFFPWRNQVELTESLLSLFTGSSTRSAFVKKKTILCLSSLAVYLETDLLTKVLRTCIDALTSTAAAGSNAKPVHTLSQQESAQLRSQVVCLSSLVGSVGKKAGALLSEIIPTLIGFCQQDPEEHEDCDNLESLFELREACIQCFESLAKNLVGVEQCETHLNTFIDLCVKYTHYDPNFDYGEEEDSEGDVDMKEEGEGAEDEDEDGFGGSDYDDDEYDEGDFSDDDDTSWKVRKAAANCLVTILQTYPSLFLPLLEVAFNTLVRSLREREESVKVEVVSTLQCILSNLSSQSSSNLVDKDTKEKCIVIVNGRLPKLVRSSLKELGGKGTSSRVKVCYIHLLKSLVGSKSRGLNLVAHASDLLKQIQNLINDSNLETNTKVEAFSLVRGLLHLSDENAYNTKAMKELLSTLLSAAEEKSFKVSAESFRTLFLAMEIIQKRWDKVYNNVIVDIYDMTFSLVTASDIDQEVREEAITCMGFLLSMFPSQLPGRSEKALQALFDRSQSEVTRIPAVKTLAKIALSGQVDMSCINSKLVRELTSYLKKTNHTLKVSALAALSTIVEKKQLKSNEVDCVVENASKLINDSDAPLASTAIHMLSNIMGVHPESLPSIEAHAMPSVLAYIQSPLVQGGLVEPLQAFFSTLTKTEGATPKKTEKTLALVEQLGLGEKVKQNVRKTAAKCVASICKASGGGKSVDYAKKAITSIAKGGAADDFVVLSLLCIAEIGRGEDLSGCKKIDSTILKCFEANSEDIRGTASYALGSVSVQNLNFFLPKILSHMESHLKLRYLLLLSLKEIVTSVRGDCSECSLTEDNLLGMQEALFCYCETDEEAIRIMCAECLGYMALLKTSVIIPLLVQHLESEKPNVREVAVSAFRDALNDEQAATEGKGDVFEPVIPKFLQKMRDPDVKVKRPAILLLNVLLHNHLDAVRPLMGEALPMLYEATDFKKESLREIELGPFTQIVDDSLQVRRAAYECLLTTVNRSFDTVRPGADAFMDLIINGASDHYDISKISHLSLADHYSLKMTCYGILARLGEVYPPGCVAKASLILPPLYKTLIYSLKSDAVKQEKERLEEVQSACMKCIAKISHVPGMKETEMFGKLMISFNKKPDLLKMFNSF